MRCRKAQKFISHYVDNELSLARQKKLELHLSECDSCQKFLADFQSIASAAAHLETPELSDAVWLRIKETLAGEKSQIKMPVYSVASRHPARKWLRVAAVPAVALLLVVFGIIIGQRFSVQQAQKQRPGDPNYTLTKLDEAERNLKLTIKSLSEAFASQKDNFSPEIVEIFHKNLAVIDVSIEACRRAVKAEPYNLEARNFLIDAYLSKVNLLDSAVHFDQAVFRQDNSLKNRKNTF